MNLYLTLARPVPAAMREPANFFCGVNQKRKNT